jgi:hypothetical protein
MALLYQAINNVPGLSGNSFQKQQQLYEKLGSPMGPYKGTYDQNIWLLDQVNSGNHGQQQPQAQPQQQSSSQPQQQSQNPQMDVNKVIEDSFRKLQEELVSKYSQYKSSNPFSLDQVLAQKTVEAKEQIDPYYNEKVSDYLTGVTRKMDRSQTDSKDLLTQLQADTDSYSGNMKLKLSEAIAKSEQGFADAGLFSSGANARNEGLLKVGANQDTSDFLRNQEFKKKGITNDLSRSIEDITAAKTSDIRDLERQRYTDTQQRAGQLTKEAGQSYVTGFKATLPLELQAQSGFDILKDIGIYQ